MNVSNGLEPQNTRLFRRSSKWPNTLGFLNGSLSILLAIEYFDNHFLCHSFAVIASYIPCIAPRSIRNPFFTLIQTRHTRLLEQHEAPDLDHRIRHFCSTRLGWPDS